MKIWHIMKKEDLENQLQKYGRLVWQGDFLHCSTPSSWSLVEHPLAEDEVVIVLDDRDPSLDVRYEDGGSGILFPHIYSPVKKQNIIEILESDRLMPVNVLLSTSMIDEEWVRPWMKNLISKTDRVCVVALSYFDDTKTEDDWNRQYAPGKGIYYPGNNDVFFAYGIRKDQIVWINPWKDTPLEMENKIRSSSILMLCGGAPELYMKRIKKLHLKKALQQFQGLVIGYSAGAMIQLADYHISKDPDYDHFSWQKGLGMLSGFDVEVHFHEGKDQMEGLETVLEEKRIPVYALYEDGALVCKDRKPWQCFGKTALYEPED